MRIDEGTYEITTTQHDFGVPINFDAGTEQGFQVNDTIVFIFEPKVLENKPFTVTSEDFSFSLSLTKEEAELLSQFDLIKYSIKRYRGTQFLESLKNALGETVFNLIIEKTLKYEEGEENGEANST